jgi:hypothetical protein
VLLPPHDASCVGEAFGMRKIGKGLRRAQLCVSMRRALLSAIQHSPVSLIDNFRREPEINPLPSRHSEMRISLRVLS